MTYRLDPGTPMRDALVTVARDQVDTAIDASTSWRDDPVESIHDVRKRCKKVRGLVRLFRSSLDDRYTSANETFRDAARLLGPTRDAHALAETFDTVVVARSNALDVDALAPVADELRRRSRAATESILDDDSPIVRARDLLERGRRSIDGWTLDDEGFDAVAGGLAKTYRRGRKRLADALAAPSPEAFHEYRKRTKYTWYHVRLLRDLAPSVMRPLASSFHDLGDALGDAHDLSVLADAFEADESAFGGREPVAAARLVLDGQRAELRRRAVSLGPRLHAEPTQAFVDRFRAYWAAWHEHGSELTAGDVDALAAAGVWR